MKKNVNVDALWTVMRMLESEQTEEALAEVISTMLSVLKAESAAVWLKNEGDGHVYCVSSAGDVSSTGYSIEAGQGIVGEACEADELIFINDAESDPRFPGGKDEITAFTVKNMALMPMKAGKKTIGAFQIVNCRNEGGFSEDELYLIRSVAGLMAMVIKEKGFTAVSEGEKKVVMSLRNITKEYVSGVETLKILKGIDLDIFENEFLVILGESGCGKSTLLNIIGAMDSPSGGTITVDEKDFSHPQEKDLVEFRRDEIGFIFQAYHLMPNLTAIENVEYIAEICKNPGNSAEAIEMVGLTDRANNYPSMMSGGQQQRVSIARAIVKNPRIILADEPTAALDYNTSIEVLELIEKLIAAKRTTVVMVTHNAEIAKMANRVVKVKGGKISSIRINPWPRHASELVW